MAFDPQHGGHSVFKPSPSESTCEYGNPDCICAVATDCGEDTCNEEPECDHHSGAGTHFDGDEDEP